MDLKAISDNTGAVIIDKKNLSLGFFNRSVLIDIYLKKIHYYSVIEGMIIQEEEPDLFSSAIILHFLTNAARKPLTGEWILYRELPDGLYMPSPYRESCVRW